MTEEITVPSPLGPLAVTAENGAITAVSWRAANGDRPTPLLARAAAALAAYFAGASAPFDLPLAPRGSAFDRRVWQALARIGYGETRSYGALARALGTSPRAVGGACARNPIPILIPCHRVLAASGALGGYSGAGGTATKRRLLDLERRG